MANTYSLLDLNSVLRDIGRGVVFYASKWDGETPLSLTHLGDTEGEITVELNESYNHLTTPELTGEAKHKSYLIGEDPVVTIPLWLADPALRAIVSPTGNASGGYSRPQRVTEYTLVIFPEELFRLSDGTFGQLKYDSQADPAWSIGGGELTEEQEALLGQAVWFWRGYFTKPGPVFRAEDGGKIVIPVNFQAMPTDLAIEYIDEGDRIYTIGDPGAKGIDIDPGVA